MLTMLPWLYKLAMLSICLGLISGLLGSIHASQGARYGKLLRAASVMLGLTLWLRSIILVYYVWGKLLVFLGIALGGVGIIPFAIVAFCMTGYFKNAFFLAIWLGIALLGYKFARTLMYKEKRPQ